MIEAIDKKKAVEISKDVIKQLEGGIYIPTPGTYFENSGPVHCDVCALGAAAVSFLGRSEVDDINLHHPLAFNYGNQYDMPTNFIRKKLETVFGPRLLGWMEGLFEGDMCYISDLDPYSLETEECESTCKDLVDDFKGWDNYDTMYVIFQNIIDNDGCLDPNSLDLDI